MRRPSKHLRTWLLYASGSCFAWILGCDSGIRPAAPVRPHPVASSEKQGAGEIPAPIDRFLGQISRESFTHVTVHFRS